MTEIRRSAAEDHAGIEQLYPQAFPDEDLLPVVGELLSAGEICLSLVAVIDKTVVGHAVFTACRVEGSDAPAMLLGPLAVAPAYQRQGIGTALIEQGFQQCATDGASVVCVLGDPAYYGRFGFRPDNRIEPPYRLPEEWAGAWQSRYVDAESERLEGPLRVPAPWQHAALWLP